MEDKKPSHKDQHSEHERRRRDKITAFASELMKMFQTPSASAKKLDKLTLLEMATEHVKKLKGTPFLTTEELTQLGLKAADGFQFVVSCDTGSIVHASESAASILKRPLESCFYDNLHPEDVDEVKAQISIRGLYAQPKKRMATGLKRTFACRMKAGNSHELVFCSGYIKRWLETQVCFVAVGRTKPTSAPKPATLVEGFSAKFGLDGTITFVDPKVTSILGYTTLDLLTKNSYDFFHPDDQMLMQKTFNEVLRLKGQVHSVMCRFKAKNGQWVPLQMSANALVNPYNQSVEYIVSKNTLWEEPQVLHIPEVDGDYLPVLDSGSQTHTFSIPELMQILEQMKLQRTQTTEIQALQETLTQMSTSGIDFFQIELPSEPQTVENLCQEPEVLDKGAGPPLGVLDKDAGLSPEVSDEGSDLSDVLQMLEQVAAELSACKPTSGDDPQLRVLKGHDELLGCSGSSPPEVHVDQSGAGDCFPPTPDVLQIETVRKAADGYGSPFQIPDLEMDDQIRMPSFED